MKAYPPVPEECLNFYVRGTEQVRVSNSPKTCNSFLAMLAGQQTSVVDRYVERIFLNFQVVFQPAALFRLTGIPSYELANKYLDGELIFPKSIRSVHEQLEYAENYQEMLEIADKFVAGLVSRASRQAHRMDKAVMMMQKTGGNIAMDRLVNESCLCYKQFKRKFTERVGVNPKMYANIIRFTKALDTKNLFPDKDWFAIAMECGYFDYQHLVKSYARFTGLTPNKFHLLENNSPESVLGIKSDISRTHGDFYE